MQCLDLVDPLNRLRERSIVTLTDALGLLIQLLQWPEYAPRHKHDRNDGDHKRGHEHQRGKQRSAQQWIDNIFPRLGDDQTPLGRWHWLKSDDPFDLIFI